MRYKYDLHMGVTALDVIILQYRCISTGVTRSLNNKSTLKFTTRSGSGSPQHQEALRGTWTSSSWTCTSRKVFLRDKTYLKGPN